MKPLTKEETKMKYRVTASGEEVREFDTRGEAMKHQRRLRNEGKRAFLWFQSKTGYWREVR